MSLEGSAFTFSSLCDAGDGVFKAEVDRIVKDVGRYVGRVGDDDADGGPPAKRARSARSQSEALPDSQDSGIGSQPRSQHLDVDDDQQEQATTMVSGTVQEVTLENFLCHENFTFRFNSPVTIITGDNGAGKSSLLTAVVIALGGTAFMTGRGAALKDFVKYGAPWARVTCVLNNNGPVKYKKELFGKSIRVVRTITQQGGSTVQLRSYAGKLVSSRMDDLRSMILFLGIQVSNPLSVLPQATAKEFLRQDRPEKLYEFFMQATNLEALQRILISITDYVNLFGRELRRKEQQLIERNNEVSEAGEKIKLLESLEEDRKQMDLLKTELLWAEARESKVAIDLAQEKKRKVQEEKERVNSIISSEAVTEPVLHQIESSKKHLKAIENQVKDIDKEIKDLRVDFSSTSLSLQNICAEKEKMETKIKEEEISIEEYRKEICSLESRMLPEYAEMRRQQRKQITELEKTIQSLQNERESKKADLISLEQTIYSFKKNLEQWKYSKTSLEKDLRIHTNEREALKASNGASNSKLALFGPCMPALVKVIEENVRKFSVKPVGPLGKVFLGAIARNKELCSWHTRRFYFRGAYIKVKDTQWVRAVESALGNRLNSFVVANNSDEKLLRTFINRIFQHGKPGLIRTKFLTEIHDTSGRKACTKKFSCFMDIIEVSNVMVLNVLIDVCRIEEILLVPTDDECFELLSVKRNVPNNCSKAYTKKGDVYFPAPNYSTYHAGKSRFESVLQTSHDEAVRSCHQKISQLENEMQTVIQNVTETAKKVFHQEQCIHRTKQEITNLTQKLIDERGILEQLKDQEQPDIGTASVLRDEMNERENVLQKSRNYYDAIPAKVDSFKQKIEQLKKSGSALKRKKEAIMSEMSITQSQLISLEQQLAESRSGLKGLKVKLDRLKEQELNYSKECEKLQEGHVKCVADAEKYEAHIMNEMHTEGQPSLSMKSTGRALRVIDSELRKLKKKLESVEKHLGNDVASLEEDFQLKLNMYNKTQGYIDCLKMNVQNLETALKVRKDLYHFQKKLATAISSHQFTRILRIRNYLGCIRVNFETKQLTIVCNGGGPAAVGSAASTSQLSGGERSYTTAAFLMALWLSTDIPFYIMDELDVYMDPVNRMTMFRKLVEGALHKKRHQFGFISPQTISLSSSYSGRVGTFRLCKEIT